jgi:hypothetical protein
MLQLLWHRVDRIGDDDGQTGILHHACSYTGDELMITIIWLVARPFLRKTGWVVITLELCARLDEYA